MNVLSERELKRRDINPLQPEWNSICTFASCSTSSALVGNILKWCRCCKMKRPVGDRQIVACFVEVMQEETISCLPTVIVVLATSIPSSPGDLPLTPWRTDPAISRGHDRGNWQLRSNEIAVAACPG